MVLDDTRILLWCWSIDDVRPGDWALLDATERARANLFLVQQHRARFIRAHGGLRQVLGRVLGRAPGELVFDSNRFGKPVLADGGPDFSLSHSAGLAALAVGRIAQIGVDIELIRPIEHDMLARDNFSPTECRDLAALPPEQRAEAFFGIWTRKEAYLKALGVGLSAPLDGFSVSVTPGNPAALLSVDAAPEEALLWRVVSFEPAPGFVGSVAARGTAWKIDRRPAEEAEG